jgi:hypothetical protein
MKDEGGKLGEVQNHDFVDNKCVNCKQQRKKT